MGMQENHNKDLIQILKSENDKLKIINETLKIENDLITSKYKILMDEYLKLQCHCGTIGTDYGDLKKAIGDSI